MTFAPSHGGKCRALPVITGEPAARAQVMKGQSAASGNGGWLAYAARHARTQGRAK